MTDKPQSRPRGRPPKSIPRIEASPERVACAIFSAVKPSDPTIRVQKTHVRKPKATLCGE